MILPAADITGTAPNETVTLPGNWKTSTESWCVYKFC